MVENSVSNLLVSAHWPLRLKVLLAHLGALPVTLAGLWLAAQLGLPSDFAALAILEGFSAALLARVMQLPNWWQLISLVFLPLVWFFLALDIDPVWYLLGFVLLALTSIGAVTSRVPLYLSSQKAHHEVLHRLSETPQTRVLELGCGLGGLLAYLSKHRPEVQLHGVDAAPLPWLFSRLRLGNRAQIRLGNLWREDLSQYDLVYAYLSPEPMPELWRKVLREMQPGSLFISNTFSVPGVEADETVELNDLSQARLLIWQIR